MIQLAPAREPSVQKLIARSCSSLARLLHRPISAKHMACKARPVNSSPAIEPGASQRAMRSRAKQTTSAPTKPTTGSSHIRRAGGSANCRLANTVSESATAAPAPLLMPSKAGSAIGLRNSACASEPASASAAPTARASTRRGRRSCHSTWALPLKPSLSTQGGSSQSPSGIGRAPSWAQTTAASRVSSPITTTGDGRGSLREGRTGPPRVRSCFMPCRATRPAWAAAAAGAGPKPSSSSASKDTTRLARPAGVSARPGCLQERRDAAGGLQAFIGREDHVRRGGDGGLGRQLLVAADAGQRVANAGIAEHGIGGRALAGDAQLGHAVGQHEEHARRLAGLAQLLHALLAGGPVGTHALDQGLGLRRATEQLGNALDAGQQALEPVLRAQDVQRHLGQLQLAQHGRRAGVFGGQYQRGRQRQQALGRQCAHVADIGQGTGRARVDRGAVHTDQRALSAQRIDHLGQRAADADHALGGRCHGGPQGQRGRRQRQQLPATQHAASSGVVSVRLSSSSRQSQRSAWPGLRSPKNWAISCCLASNSSSEQTRPSLVGLRTSQALAMWSSRRCRLKPGSSTLSQGPITATRFTGPLWIWIMPGLPTKHMRGTASCAARPQQLLGTGGGERLDEAGIGEAQGLGARDAEALEHAEELVRVAQRSPGLAEGGDVDLRVELLGSIGPGGAQLDAGLLVFGQEHLDQRLERGDLGTRAQEDLVHGLAGGIKELQAALDRAVGEAFGDRKAMGPLRIEHAQVDGAAQHQAHAMLRAGMGVDADLLVHAGLVAGQGHQLAQRFQ